MLTERPAVFENDGPFIFLCQEHAEEVHDFLTRRRVEFKTSAGAGRTIQVSLHFPHCLRCGTAHDGVYQGRILTGHAAAWGHRVLEVSPWESQLPGTVSGSDHGPK